MKKDCPATRLFKRLQKHFSERLESGAEKKQCVFKKLAKKPLFSPNSLKGRVSEETLARVEKDESIREEMARGMVKDLSILFADIRGFTNRTANMAPDKIVTLLDLFVPEMLNIIINRHRGTVDKLLGDGIMAVYGHPYSSGEEIIQALFSAVDMQQAAAALDQVLNLAGYDPIEIGVGINCGKVLLCEVGDDRYRESTVIGAPVNLAAKMEDVAGAGEIALPEPALVQVETLRPSMIPYFSKTGSHSGVTVMSFDWVKFVEKGAQEVEDWRVD